LAAEAEGHIDAFERGKMTAIPAIDVFSEIDKPYNKEEL
jgi:hypothetical protein